MVDSLQQGGVLAYLLVFVAAAIPVVEVLVVIPAGIAAGMAPAPVAVVALAGNLSTVAAVVFAGDHLMGLLRRRRSDDGEPSRPRRSAGRAQRILQRWGTPGLALLAPVSTGTHVAAMAALAIGASRRRVLAWMAVGLVAWAIAVTIAAVVGFDLLLG